MPEAPLTPPRPHVSLDSDGIEAPERHSGETITVTRELVEEKLSSIVRDRDLSRYVL